MAKLSRETVVTREKFIYNIFRNNPGLSVAKANAELLQAHGSQMNAARMYQLREMAANGEPGPVDFGSGVPTNGHNGVHTEDIDNSETVEGLEGNDGEEIVTNRKSPVHGPVQARQTTGVHPVIRPAAPRGRPPIRRQQEQVAYRNPGHSEASEAGQALPMLVKLDGLGPAEAVAAAFEELRMAGLINLQVDTNNPRYIVVDIAH